MLAKWLSSRRDLVVRVYVAEIEGIEILLLLIPFFVALGHRRVRILFSFVLVFSMTLQ
jgi:hypothetical protein